MKVDFLETDGEGKIAKGPSRVNIHMLYYYDLLSV